MKKYSNYSQEKLNDKLKLACKNGDIVKVRYLLSSLNLKIHADIHHNNDSSFKDACIKGYLEIVKYFIFEKDIKKTLHIKNYLIDFPNEKVEEMFKINKLSKKLEKKLSSNNVNITKKVKV